MNNKNQEVEPIIQSIKGLYENQNIINEKLNAILMIQEELDKKMTVIHGIESQLYNLSINLNKIDVLTNKMSDIEILLQNTSSDHDTINSSIADTINHIDSLSRSFQQWKIYSEI